MPADDMPWPLFLALLERCDRFDSRELLRMIESTTRGARRALGFAGGLEEAQIADLQVAAYGRHDVAYAIVQEPLA